MVWTQIHRQHAASTLLFATISMSELCLQVAREKQKATRPGMCPPGGDDIASRMHRSQWLSPNRLLMLYAELRSIGTMTAIALMPLATVHIMAFAISAVLCALHGDAHMSWCRVLIVASLLVAVIPTLSALDLRPDSALPAWGTDPRWRTMAAVVGGGVALAGGQYWLQRRADGALSPRYALALRTVQLAWNSATTTNLSKLAIIIARCMVGGTLAPRDLAVASASIVALAAVALGLGYMTHHTLMALIGTCPSLNWVGGHIIGTPIVLLFELTRRPDDVRFPQDGPTSPALWLLCIVLTTVLSMMIVCTYDPEDHPRSSTAGEEESTGDISDRL